MPRTGRPKSDNPKESSVKVRFDAEQYSKLESYCEQHSATKAQAIRDGVDLLLRENEKEDNDGRKDSDGRDL